MLPIVVLPLLNQDHCFVFCIAEGCCRLCRSLSMTSSFLAAINPNWGTASYAIPSIPLVIQYRIPATIAYNSLENTHYIQKLTYIRVQHAQRTKAQVASGSAFPVARFCLAGWPKLSLICMRTDEICPQGATDAQSCCRLDSAGWLRDVSYSIGAPLHTHFPAKRQRATTFCFEHFGPYGLQLGFYAYPVSWLRGRGENWWHLLCLIHAAAALLELAAI